MEISVVFYSHTLIIILTSVLAHDAKMGLTETRLAIIPGGGNNMLYDNVYALTKR